MAIARAVVGDRRLLLADEPTGALDSVNGEDVMRLLRRACQRGVAGVIVTHDAQLAAWADRVVFLRDGRMVDQTARPAGPESLLTPGALAVTSRPRRSKRPQRPAPASTGGRGTGGGLAAAPGRGPLGLAAVPPRVAPAGARGGAAHAGGRRRGGRFGGGPRHGPDRGRRSRLRRPPHRPDVGEERGQADATGAAGATGDPGATGDRQAMTAAELVGQAESAFGRFDAIGQQLRVGSWFGGVG